MSRNAVRNSYKNWSSTRMSSNHWIGICALLLLIAIFFVELYIRCLHTF